MNKDGYSAVTVRELKFPDPEFMPPQFRDLDALFPHWHDTGKEWWIEAGEKGEQVSQTMLAVSPSKNTAWILSCSWDGGADRHAVLGILHRFLRDEAVSHYAMFSEVWVRTGREVVPGVTVVTDDKDDGFMCVGVDSMGRTRTRMHTRTRDEDGKWVHEEQERSTAMEMGGQLMDLLKDDPRFDIPPEHIFKVGDKDGIDIEDEEAVSELLRRKEAEHAGRSS